jgi:pseudouridine synthase
MSSSTDNKDVSENIIPQHKRLETYEGTAVVRWLVLQRVCRNRKIASDAIQNRSVVTINGEACTSLSTLIRDGDEVEFESRPVKRTRIEHAYYILHKPKGCVSSRRNVLQTKYGTIPDLRPTVYDYIPEEDRTHVNSIGRLDVDTTGLLIFTSDGILHNALASPEFKVAKIYRCTLNRSEPLSEEAIDQLMQGVTLPHAKGAVVSGDAWNVTQDGVVDLRIMGGYKHQVKLMLRLVKRPLRLLHRRTFADLEIPDDVKEGECRKMTTEEVEHLYDLAKRQTDKRRASKQEEIDAAHDNALSDEKVEEKSVQEL